VGGAAQSQAPRSMGCSPNASRNGTPRPHAQPTVDAGGAAVDDTIGSTSGVRGLTPITPKRGALRPIVDGAMSEEDGAGGHPAGVGSPASSRGISANHRC
jgi:hypothetical protein